MKAEHRHELKTNELAEWLANLPVWAKENLLMLIYFAVVITGVIIFCIWRYQKNVASISERLRFSGLLGELAQNRFTTAQQQSEGFDVSYTLLQTANKLQNFAGKTKRPDMAALALVKSAEALRSELHYRSGDIDNQTISLQIVRAKEAYENAIKKAQDNPSLRGTATMGIGLCEEELRNFAKAKEIYQQILQDPNFAATTAAAAAEYRLKIMDDYKQMAQFTAPQETPEPSEQPDIMQLEIEPNAFTSPPSLVNMPAEE